MFRRKVRKISRGAGNCIQVSPASLNLMRWVFLQAKFFLNERGSLVDSLRRVASEISSVTKYPFVHQRSASSIL